MFLAKNMSDSADYQTKEASPGKMTTNEKNLVVSFIQFLRRKAAMNECTEEQTEALEGMRHFRKY